MFFDSIQLLAWLMYNNLKIVTKTLAFLQRNRTMVITYTGQYYWRTKDSWRGF